MLGCVCVCVWVSYILCAPLMFELPTSFTVYSLCQWRDMWGSCWRDCQVSWRLVRSSPPLPSRSTPGQWVTHTFPLSLLLLYHLFLLLLHLFFFPSTTSLSSHSPTLPPSSRQQMSLALSRHSQLLEVLEIPQVELLIPPPYSLNCSEPQVPILTEIPQVYTVLTPLSIIHIVNYSEPQVTIHTVTVAVVLVVCVGGGYVCQEWLL